MLTPSSGDSLHRGPRHLPPELGRPGRLEFRGGDSHPEERTSFGGGREVQL